MAWGKPMKSSKCHFTVSTTTDGPTSSGKSWEWSYVYWSSFWHGWYWLRNLHTRTKGRKKHWCFVICAVSMFQILLVVLVDCQQKLYELNVEDYWLGVWVMFYVKGWQTARCRLFFSLDHLPPPCLYSDISWQCIKLPEELLFYRPNDSRMLVALGECYEKLNQLVEAKKVRTDV